MSFHSLFSFTIFFTFRVSPSNVSLSFRLSDGKRPVHRCPARDDSPLASEIARSPRGIATKIGIRTDARVHRSEKRNFLERTLVRSREREGYAPRSRTDAALNVKVPRVKRQVGVGREGSGPSPLLVSAGPTVLDGEPRARFMANERNPSALFFVLEKGGGASVGPDDVHGARSRREVPYFIGGNETPESCVENNHWSWTVKRLKLFVWL